MTDKLDTAAIRAQMEAMAGLTAGPSVYYADLPSVEPNWHIVTTENKMRVLANVHIEPGNAMDVANASLIAAAPDMRETILSLCDALDELRADLDRGAKDYCNLMDQRDALAVRVTQLELALRPFVEYVHDDFRRGKATYELVATDRAGGGLIGAEDLRRARAALAQKEGE